MKRWWLAIGLGLPVSLSAQQDSMLREAVRLVTEGQGDSARALVRSRLSQLSPLDSAYPEAVYTGGLVAGAADSATTYFRRVAIEYSQSPWADRAFLRLAQLSFVSSDFAGAQRMADRVMVDYPQSPVRADAAYWAGRARLEEGDVVAACRLLNQAVDLSVENVELANQASFYLQRCDRLAQAGVDTVRDTTRRTPVAAPKPAAKEYSVQVAAVKSAGAADDVMQSLRKGGFEARVVREADGFLKVRVGRFKTRTEAQRTVAQITKTVGGPNRPFVVEEP